MDSILYKFQTTFGTSGYDSYDFIMCGFFVALFTVIIFRLFSDIIHKL